MDANASVQSAPPFQKSRPELDRGSEATIHLCAAAYLDPEFRERAVQEVYSRHDRAVAPNPGADAGPVFRHVRIARAIDLAEQLTLAGLLLGFIVTPSVNKLVLITCLGAWLLVGLRVRKLGNDLKISANQRRIEASKLLRWCGGRVSARQTAAIALVLAAFIWFDLRTAERPIWIWLAVLAGTCMLFECLRMYCLSRVPSKAFGTPAGRRARYIMEAQHSEVIVHPRDRSDQRFPGFGENLGGVSFLMPLRPAQSGSGQTKPPEAVTFTVTELLSHVRSRIEALSEDSAATRGLPALEVADQFFVSDRFVTDPVLNLEELPEAVRPTGGFDGIAELTDAPVRRQLRCQVSAQGGEVVATLFAYFTLQGGSLYMRLSRCALPATKEDYHVFRDGALHRKRAMAWCGALAVATAPIEVIRSPYDLLLTALRTVKHTVSGRPALRGWRPADCGAHTGLREIGYDSGDRNLEFSEAFQYLYILQQQVLEALRVFLQERHIDTSALEDHMTAFVNYGVINNGEMNAGAVGTNPHAAVGVIGAGGTGTVQQQGGKG